MKHTFYKKGLTLIEVLVVVVIIGILASIMYVSIASARDKARFARALSDIESIRVAVELYRQDHGGRYPCNVSAGDVPRAPQVGNDCRSGTSDTDTLEPYLSGGVWPTGPWDGSVYDWENVEDVDNPNNDDENDDNGIGADNVVQISLRFFCQDGPDAGYGLCNVGEQFRPYFSYRSSIYYCIRGACRPHTSFRSDDTDISLNGYCINEKNPTIHPGLCVR